MKTRWITLVILVTAVLLGLAACAPQSSKSTYVPPTATSPPPTATTPPPTATSPPPTATFLPPTDTLPPPTATDVPTVTPTAPEIPPSDLVIIFSDGKCTLNSPLDLKAGENTVSVFVGTSGYDLFAFSLVNLSEGKGRNDLNKYFTRFHDESWIHEIANHNLLSGDLKTYVITLEAKPLYVSCYGLTNANVSNPLTKFGLYGPIDVDQ